MVSSITVKEFNDNNKKSNSTYLVILWTKKNQALQHFFLKCWSLPQERISLLVLLVFPPVKQFTNTERWTHRHDVGYLSNIRGRGAEPRSYIMTCSEAVELIYLDIGIIYYHILCTSLQWRLYYLKPIHVINRPGVAGAVLQTASSLIN